MQRQVEEEEEPIQTKGGKGGTPSLTSSMESSITSLRGAGSPLPDTERAFFEPRFGHDFSRVRIHTDAKAAESARQVRAAAYTVDHHMVFDSGRFAPQTVPGRRLLAHELSHTIQQGAAVQRQAELRHPSVTTNNCCLRPTIQRAMGFEFQTTNILTTNTGRTFPRKFPNTKALGQFFHKGKTGVELQTDTDSVVEFETAPFRTFSLLKQRVEEAVDIVKEIKKDPKKFAFSQEKAFKDQKLLSKEEKLEVDIKDPTFTGDIQSTEGLTLVQYESLLKEHEQETKFIDPVIKDAERILDDAKANTKITTNTDNLRGFLQLIINYLRRAESLIADPSSPEVVKATFRLMHRTNFSSMFSSLLSKDEKTLFKEIVKTNAIPVQLSIPATDPVFKAGYWGHVGKMMALFLGGKILVLATEDPNKAGQRIFHNCGSKVKTPGIDTTKCQSKFPATDIRVGAWLDSIVTKKKDLLSPPSEGSESMGKKPVPSEGEEKGLAILETRGYKKPKRDRSQPVDKWVDFVDDVFSQAAACRPRAGTGTELIYDGSKPFDPKKCP